jgi:hypothetical protein
MRLQPSTHLPPLQALAHRVDQVLMATSPPPIFNNNTQKARMMMRMWNNIRRRHGHISGHQTTPNTSLPTWDRTITRKGRWGDDDAHGTRALHYEQLLVGRKPGVYRGGMSMGGESPAPDTHHCEHLLAGGDWVLMVMSPPSISNGEEVDQQ